MSVPTSEENIANNLEDLAAENKETSEASDDHTKHGIVQDDIQEGAKTCDTPDGENTRVHNSSLVGNTRELLAITEEQTKLLGELKVKDKAVGSSNETNVEMSNQLLEDTLVQQVRKMGIAEEKLEHVKSVVFLMEQTQALKDLMSYDFSSDEESDTTENDSTQHASLSDSSNSGRLCHNHSDSESFSSEEDEISSTADLKNEKTAGKKASVSSDQPPNSLGEMNMADFPPLPNLNTLEIDYDKEEFLYIGNVKAIIDTLVTIETLPNTPAYDLETVLFADHQTSKRPLGVIFDVIGPVASPIYCVRFNTKQEMEKMCVKVGMSVYSAPKSELTQYVFLKELMKIKGTDASWLGDTEAPSEMAERSSDEDEAAASQNPSVARDSPRPVKRKRNSLERHQRFEKTMNQCNNIYNRMARMADSWEEPPRRQVAAGSDVQSAGGSLPYFNPNVPPPGFVEDTRIQHSPYHPFPELPPIPNFFPQAAQYQHELPAFRGPPDSNGARYAGPPSTTPPHRPDFREPPQF